MCLSWQSTSPNGMCSVFSLCKPRHCQLTTGLHLGLFPLEIPPGLAGVSMRYMPRQFAIAKGHEARMKIQIRVMVCFLLATTIIPAVRRRIANSVGEIVPGAAARRAEGEASEREKETSCV